MECCSDSDYTIQVKTHKHSEYKARKRQRTTTKALAHQSDWKFCNLTKQLCSTCSIKAVRVCEYSSLLQYMSVQYESLCFLSRHAVWAVISGICQTTSLSRAWLRLTTGGTHLWMRTWACSHSSLIKHFYTFLHVEIPCIEYQQTFILSCWSRQLIWCKSRKFYFSQLSDLQLWLVLATSIHHIHFFPISMQLNENGCWQIQISGSL